MFLHPTCHEKTCCKKYGFSVWRKLFHTFLPSVPLPNYTSVSPMMHCEQDESTHFNSCPYASGEEVKGKCWDYSPIVQSPYGLGVAKTVLHGWRHRQSVSWTSVYSLIRRTWTVGDGVCTHVNTAFFHTCGSSVTRLNRACDSPAYENALSRIALVVRSNSGRWLGS